MIRRYPQVIVGLMLTLGSFMAGCGAKEEQPTPSAPAQRTDSATVAPQSAPAAASPAAAPIPVQIAPAADPKAAMSDIDAAMQAKEYERAIKTMLAVQQAKLTEQQAQAAQSKMIQLQRDLAGAVARGDPQAKAAADLLRRSASGGR